ncbi:MAG: 2-C-methyl-D-erythritol 2,4-cyclodiphosphate synthase [Deltaproteobacteria bacterium]|nr:2-C-methyl-D-erythritol 2,4-cyclodiphosphate synthase [Deltaproteobacteria bacterium]
MRAGIGYDLHRLVEGRPLVLGGVGIEYPKGCLGHSDADVLLHAVIDALLGAAGLGDIGRHFPPDNPAYKDISSLLLLEKTALLIKKNGFAVVNVDSTIVCQAPRLAPYIPLMAEKTAWALGVEPRCVNIKAKTEEGLGATGSGEAISAYAVALITEKKPA